MLAYLSLFSFSFLAATILPFSSEVLLATLLATENYNKILLLFFASFGNILGSSFNWFLLFAWVPVVGDPLTYIAGTMKIRFSIFILLVSIGKIGRYLFISLLI